MYAIQMLLGLVQLYLIAFNLDFSNLCMCNLMFCFRAFVFFSSPIHKELVAQIKKETRVLPRIGALSEVKLFTFVKFTCIMNFMLHY